MDLTPIDASTTHTQTQTQTIEHTNSQQTQTPPPPTTNGSLKRHHPLPATAIAAAPPLSMVISYKECLKNHAATIGGHALDGCGEFMPSSSSNPSEPRSLTCAACGCHRNFHRRDPESLLPHHHHHHPNFLSFYHHSSSPPLPQRGGLSLSTSPSTTSPSPSPSASPISSPSSPPPAPLSHHFPPPPPPPYSSFHHHHMNNNSPSTVVVPNMLLSLGNAACSSGSGFNHQKDLNSSKKRHRTKFSKEQKEKMLRFSEKLGWRMQRDEDGLIQEFCNQIGVSRGVFKVWMHNNKNTFFRNRNNNNNDNASAAEKNGSLNGVHNGNHIDNDNDDDHNNNDNGNGNQHSNNTSSSNDDIHRDY